LYSIAAACFILLHTGSALMPFVTNTLQSFQVTCGSTTAKNGGDTKEKEAYAQTQQ
jgi:hypothetical protein